MQMIPLSLLHSSVAGKRAPQRQTSKSPHQARDPGAFRLVQEADPHRPRSKAFAIGSGDGTPRKGLLFPTGMKAPPEQHVTGRAKLETEVGSQCLGGGLSSPPVSHFCVKQENPRVKPQNIHRPEDDADEKNL